MLGYIVGVRQTVQDICINRLRINRLCAKISTMKQGKNDSFFTTVIIILHVTDLSENSVNKNVEVKTSTTQTDNDNFSNILMKVNTSKYELSALEKQLKIVRAKLSCEKNELSHAQRKNAHYLPKNVRMREQYESRRVLDLTERNQALKQDLKETKELVCHLEESLKHGKSGRKRMQMMNRKPKFDHQVKKNKKTNN